MFIEHYSNQTSTEALLMHAETQNTICIIVDYTHYAHKQYQFPMTNYDR